MKLKVFMPAAGEGWIGDVTTNEFAVYTSHEIVHRIDNADVIWMYSKWISNHFPLGLLQEKPCITTVHHIVPEKGIDIEYYDSFTDVYHVPNDKTLESLSQRTQKQIVKLPYWVPTAFKKQDVDVSSFPNSVHDAKFVLGSFQRDTEGSSIGSNNPLPKLEKGPDILAGILERFWDDQYYLMLAGWRRQYIKSRVPNHRLIDFTQGKDPDAKSVDGHVNVNKLYNALRVLGGIYMVTSRYEGGPQAILEAAATGCKILSTDVGIAKDVLHPDCICGDPSDTNIIDTFEEKIRNQSHWDEIVEFNTKKVESLKIEAVIASYDSLIEKVYEKNA